jgi:hypothetical protein
VAGLIELSSGAVTNHAPPDHSLATDCYLPAFSMHASDFAPWHDIADIVQRCWHEGLGTNHPI